MAFRLRSREVRFRAQFTAIAVHLADGAQLLAELLGSDRARRQDLADRMQELDQEVVGATHGILRTLAAAFVTPFDRVDVYRLAWSMRSCSRRMDSVVDLMIVYDLEALPSGMTEQIRNIVRAADLTREAMPLLGRTRALSEAWDELTLVRTQSREANHRVLADLTREGGEVGSIIRLVTVAQALDEVVRAFEDVAHVLAQIVVKES